MSSPDSPPQPEQGNFQPLQGLLLTGEGLTSMTAERLAMLGEMVGGLGLQVTVIEGIEGLTEATEQESEPVLTSFEDFIRFGDQNGYSRRRVHVAWRAVVRASSLKDVDPYPLIRHITPRDSRKPDTGWVDLWSVHARLVASHMQDQAWSLKPRDTGTVSFLAHIVDDIVRPDEPLSH